MAKARWWMCDGCRSLNDMPANKCYKCRSPRPANPTLLDDQYGQVGGAQARVGISVDRSRVAELAARDPVESQKGGGVVDAFAAQDDEPVESARAVGDAKPVPPPIREPVKRGISEIGGQDWRSSLPTSPVTPTRPPGPDIPPGPAVPAAGVAQPQTRPIAPTPASMPPPGTFPPPTPGVPMPPSAAPPSAAPPPAAPPSPAGMLVPPPGSLPPTPAAPPRGGPWPPPPAMPPPAGSPIAEPPPGPSQPWPSAPQPVPGLPRPPGGEGETTPG